MENIAELNRLRKCKRKAEEKNDLKELGSVCNAIGELLSQYGYHEEAIAEHEAEQRASKALRDKIGEAVACRKIGECYCKLGQFDKALKFQNEYLALAQECNDQVEVQRALATLGDTYYTQADTQAAESSRHLLDEAEKKFLQALRVCTDLRGSSALRESEYLAMKGRLLLNLGLVYDVRGAEKESTEYLQKALTIAKQGRLEEEEFLCHFNSANQMLRRGQPIAAGLSLQHALTLATRQHSKPRQREVNCQLGITYVCAGDVRSAKHCLKKAYRLLPTAEDSAKFIKLYKTVNAVEELCERLSACSPEDPEMFGIHEKLGDAFTEIGMHCGSYATAVQHYQQMVECGERLGLGADKLIPAYVSLAQTYADNRQPDLAISSYHKELELRGDNHEQICRTWLNIAELEEKKGEGYKVLSKAYMSAFSHAKKANHPKLQVQVLRSLMAVQVVFKEHRHKEQTEEKLKQVQAKYRVETSESGSEEDDSQALEKEALVESNHDADISISDLTDSDKSDEENVRPVISHPVSSTRVRRYKNFKKNEKGETPLHVACINGSEKRVRSLLAEGHPVQVRDHCGWTPLHEAANHDHPSIVELLLDAGADINDRGGAECGGFTPLIDAAACGNLDIVKLLVNRGANVLAKDDKGCTALQALRTWFTEYADAADEDSVAHYNSVLLLLQERMSGVVETRIPGSRSAPVTTGPGSSVHWAEQGALIPPSPSPSTSRSSRSVSQPVCKSSQRPPNHTARHKQRPVTNVSSEEEEGAVYCNPQLDNLTSPTQSATEAYRSSMLALGSSSQRAAVRASVCRPSTSGDSSSRTSRPALVSEQEMVGDDWLIDDLQPSSRKRRDRSSLGSILSTDSIRTVRQHKRARLSTKHKHQTSLYNSSDTVRGDEVEQESDEDRVSSPSHFTTSSVGHRVRHGVVSDSSSVGHRVRHGVVSDSSSVGHRVRHGVVSDSSNVGHRVRHGAVSDSSSEEDNVLPVLSHNSRTKACLRLTDSVETTADADWGEGPDEVSDSHTGLGTQEGHDARCQSVLETANQTQTTNQTGSSVNPVSTGPVRVRVKIEGSVFLIPLPAVEHKTVGWLSEEASQRYSSHFGRRPFLTLSSADGAILSTDDVLSAVVRHDEQLDGKVYGWDQPALSDRYIQACKTLNTVRYRNICGILKEAETSSKLSLSGLGLRSTVLLPITRALRGQTCLTQLHLPDNHLGDSGLQGLLPALEDLRSLTHLNLCGNGITALGFSQLSALFTATTSNAVVSLASPVLPMLQQLDVSHNPLGSSIGDSVCGVVRGLSSLTHLNMSSCCLTAMLFQHNRPALAACLQDSGLQQLDVSHNDLGTLGIELLLRSINIHRLTTLDLGHTCSTCQPAHLAHQLKVFITQGCTLQSLSLENCCLHRDDVDFLCRFPAEVPSLQKLNISQNKAVTMESVQTLVLNSAQCDNSHLQHLEAQLCSTHHSSSTSLPFTSFLQALKAKLWSPHPLQHLAVSCAGLDKADRDSLCDLWTGHWNQAKLDLSTHTMLLTCKQP